MNDRIGRRTQAVHLIRALIGIPVRPSLRKRGEPIDLDRFMVCGNHVFSLWWGRRLLLNGEKVMMRNNPEFPKDHERIVLVEGEIPIVEALEFDLMYKPNDHIWEVRDDKFYLMACARPYRILGEGPIFADWFSGVLEIPEGEHLVRNEHYFLGINAERQNTTTVIIKHGNVLAIRKVDTLQYLDEQHFKWLHSKPWWKAWNLFTQVFQYFRLKIRR